MHAEHLAVPSQPMVVITKGYQRVHVPIITSLFIPFSGEASRRVPVPDKENSILPLDVGHPELRDMEVPTPPDRAKNS